MTRQWPLSDPPKKMTIYGPLGVRLVIDETQAFKEDPGRGTPALVEWKGDSGTYWCAEAEGELSSNGTRLPKKIQAWLSSQRVQNIIESIRWTQ